MQYYQANSISPLMSKARVRRIHTLVVETEEHLRKIKWIRSEKAVRASLLVARRQDQSELKEVIVVVPTKWKFVKRIEALRDSAEEDQLSELVYNWRFWDIRHTLDWYLEHLHPLPLWRRRHSSPRSLG